LYAFFYFICGVAAAVLHVYTTSDPTIPTLGASGAVSGVLGAYVVFFPVHKVRMLVFPFGTMPTPAFIWIGVWFLEQILFAQMDNAGVAWYAHIGGFAAGVAMALPARVVFHKRFQRRIHEHG
jgi:membrane associated rhomboid family serine protease